MGIKISSFNCLHALTLSKSFSKQINKQILKIGQSKKQKRPFLSRTVLCNLLICFENDFQVEKMTTIDSFTIFKSFNISPFNN